MQEKVITISKREGRLEDWERRIPIRGGRTGADRAESGTGAPRWGCLTADWERALFMHFEVPAAVLQAQVPFDLDLFDGQAFVSLVAFTMRGMRPARGGWLARWLCAPLAEQRFLNLRTYVRGGGQAGIYFIAEWISQGLCVPFGPITYGLPYRWGHLDYRHEHELGVVRGRVAARRDGSVLEYEARPEAAEWKFGESATGSLARFLVERYVAFTQHRSRRRTFRIAHAPWLQAQARVEFSRDDLLRQFAPWWQESRLSGAHYSPGVCGVWMGRPRRL